MTYDYIDFMAILTEPFGPGDPDVIKTAKYKFEEYHNLYDKISKQGKVDLNSDEKGVVIDALRLFLEGVDDYEVTTTTGKEKEHFLELYGTLIKDWDLKLQKLKRHSYDSEEYQVKATKSGLVENIS